MTGGDVLLTLLGVLMILAAVRDIFHELFHPSGTGSISGQVMRAIWSIFRRISLHRSSLLSLAGPATLLLVIGSWAILLAIGWAFIFWPLLPEGFLLSTGLKPSENGGFLDALYLSMVTLTTLGYGDITPVSTILRMLVPVEALIGFALLTVSISWLLSIYPVLSHRRTLAQKIWTLRQAGSDTGISLSDETANPEDFLPDLFSQLVTARNNLIQFPITYYFHGGDEKTALSTTLPYLVDLTEQLNASENPVLRLHTATLDRAIEDFTTVLSNRFLDLPPSSSPKEILEAYARDHLYLPNNKSRS